MSIFVTRTTLVVRLGLLLLTLGVSTAACSAEPATGSGTIDSTFVGVDGIESDTSDSSRMITLSGDITEFVFELGKGDSIVATDITTVYPDEAVSLPKVGVGRFLSAEAVLKHDPSLVIGDTQTSPQSEIDKIRSSGVPVVIMDVSTTFDIVYAKVDALGEILGAEATAASLKSDLRDQIEAAGTVMGSDESTLTVAYVYTRGPDVMLLFGRGMVTHPVIEAAGARDAGSAAGVEGSITVTPEALIAAAPDVIIVPAEGLEILGGVEGLLSIPGVAQTPAGISGRILAYPEGDFLTLGPRTARSVEALSADLLLFSSTP
jgi:iron complex transport system substrate-binding protein